MAILLAFSGGLDTSFCVPYLQESRGETVYTATVNTGGLTEGEARELEHKSAGLGAAGHFLIEGRDALYRDHLRYLIMGNVLRGGVYPLCVGAERVVQARKLVELARRLGSRAIAHGSTGAGNDQMRFDSVIRLLADDLEIVTPIRDEGVTRHFATAYLEERGFEVPRATTSYSVNAGLWGTTIGGAETLTTTDPLPERAYPASVPLSQAPDSPEIIRLAFRGGLPESIDGETLDGVGLILRLAAVGSRHGVGRGIHVGDTVLGVKGRVAFEAPGPMILLTAHRELEKLVLTKWQRYQKDQLADFYGMLLHEGQHYDPVMRDIEAFFRSSQDGVDGTVTVKLFKGNILVQGCDSPNSMFSSDVATYGEEAALWDGRDARGFCRLAGMQAYIARKARQRAST